MNKEIKLVKLLKNKYFNEEIEKHDTNKLVINYSIKDKVKDCSKEFSSILKKFYEKQGFSIISEPYDWDGILHVDMLRKF